MLTSHTLRKRDALILSVTSQAVACRLRSRLYYMYIEVDPIVDGLAIDLSNAEIASADAPVE